MTLIKRNYSNLPSTFSNLFDDFFTRDLFDWGTRNFTGVNMTLPAVNIRENNEAFLVEMAAPGMDKKDFHIELDNEVLKISSEKEVRNEEKEGERYTRREFSYQSFQRTFQLPKSVVDGSKIEAKYENGVLYVAIPKKEEAKALPARQIEVK